jgi:ATP-dependent protease ClpP protease subunit
MDQKTKMAFTLNARNEAFSLDIYDVIGDGLFGGISAKNVLDQLKGTRRAKMIGVRINSRGGDVTDGFAIYNLLKDHPARVEVDIDGLAASIASVIAMAGDEIRIASNAFMMVHNPYGLAFGESQSLRQAAGVLDQMRAQIADVYVARTGIDRTHVLAMMDDETWLNAEEAKQHGFADKVVPAKAGAQTLAAFNLAGFTRVPAPLVQAVASARSEMGVSTYQDKTYAQLNGPERAQLSKEQPELFKSMREGATVKPYAQRSGRERAERSPLEKLSQDQLHALMIGDPKRYAELAQDAVARWRERRAAAGAQKKKPRAWGGPFA